MKITFDSNDLEKSPRGKFDALVNFDVAFLHIIKIFYLTELIEQGNKSQWPKSVELFRGCDLTFQWLKKTGVPSKDQSCRSQSRYFEEKVVNQTEI